MPDPDPGHAATRVAEILAAAEAAADGLRADAERRMRERIAEGERAAANRVQAAEAEALEVLAAAQEQAEKLVAEAQAAAEETRAAGQREARAIVTEASGATRDVLRDGTELSGNLRELSDSLRTNAELLLRDVRLAHAEMTARLDQAAPPSARPLPADRRGPDPLGGVDLDVPEFHPGRR